MKFAAFLFAFFAAIVVTVGATETNGQRLARGLNPLPPVRRATGTDSAHHHKPSSTPPSTCSTGSQQCCDTLSTTSDPFVETIASSINALLPGVNVPVGLGCTPLASLLGGGGCTAQVACCDHDNFNGLIVIGCSPINVL
ncbi:hydrophobin [Amanita rubescens]|nr:hydrophobin [Amanita rubescens]